MKVNRYLRFIDNLGKWSGQIIAPLVLVYMSIIIFEIVARFAFNSPTRWAHETSTYIFGAQFMLAGAYCFWRGSMVNVEILHIRLPIRARAILDALFFFIPLFIFCIMIWKGWFAFWDSLITLEHSNTPWGPPLYPLKGVIPVAAFLLLIQVSAKFTRDVYLAVKGEELK